MIPPEFTVGYRAAVSIDQCLIDYVVDQCWIQDISECYCTWPCYSFPELYFKARHHICPSHEHTSLASRISRAYQVYHPTVFKAVLEPEWTSDFEGLLLGFKRSSDCSIFHSVIKIATSIRFLTSLPCPEADVSFWLNWFELITEIISKISVPAKVQQFDIHTMLRYSVVRGGDTIGLYNDFLHIPLRYCIKALQKGGANLVRYGQFQNNIIRQYSLDDKSSPRCFFSPGYPWFSGKSRPNQDSFPVYLIAYEFGPEPSDWDIYWSEPTDVFAGDFWNLIENPPLQIPGAWEDSFNED